MQTPPRPFFGTITPAVGVKSRSFLLLGCALLGLSACTDGFNTDLRGNLGDAFSTAPSSVNTTATEAAPNADDRGVVSYPSYQVVLARKGDTVADVASRVGLDAQELARYNGIGADVTLREGELLALPRRVAEPEFTAGAAPGGIDITTLAGEAIDRAGTPITPTTTTPRTTQAEGIEPIRHKIERGETAYTIARLYNVSVRSLSDWNGLGSDLAVREGQYLLIPLASDVATATPPTGAIAGVAPGVGSPTPTPPSAKVALPDETITAAEKPKSPDLGSQQTAASESKLLMPVSGQIIRAYAKKKNDGIDIAAPAGTPVKAAEAGTVAAVTVDTDGITIVVIRHKDGLLTVYANIEAVSVKKGASVTRGQSIAKVRAGDPAFMHFEVRQGLESIDPASYI